MTGNPPVDVQEYGQSIWYDNIRRLLIENGELQQLIDDYGVLGVTSNPAIFQKAIGTSDDYDAAILTMLDLEPEDIYEKLAIEDIQHATDLFRPVYEDTGGRDGYVSLEVSPLLAHKTGETVAEAQRLFDQVGRPNVMIKIPATPAGIPAIEASIAAGLNINVTLIFSTGNYEAVAEAYIRGLEKRLAAGGDISHSASVASFFLSRIDSMVDGVLENNIRAAQIHGDTARIAANRELLGKTAVANARLAYRLFSQLFYGERFKKLEEAGARVQRPLWASTSTKNLAYPDTMYIEPLIGRDTVNTVPPNTLVAFKDHGDVAETLTVHPQDAEEIMDRLVEVGVDMEQVTQRLQDDGVEAFAEAFENLLTQVAAKRSVLKTGIMEQQKLALGIYADDVQRALQEMEDDHINARIWSKDGTVWKDHGPIIAAIQNRLGWLDVLETIDRDRLQALQDGIRDTDFTHVVLLGMGGSSLAPEVLSQTFGPQAGCPQLLVLDSTNPARIRDVEEAVDLNRTLFLVSSKSGGTIETMSFFKYFYQQTGENGAQFIAITDTGSQLETLAEEKGFRDTFLNPADIGGRYSALSYFGMVPAALIGLDLNRLWENAERMIEACGSNIAAVQHPGIWLGALIGALALQGRDKVSIHNSPSLATFGSWVEQLIAESLGKEGKGALPVVGATVGKPHDYGEDRVFIYTKVEGDPDMDELDSGIRALREAAHPRVTLTLPDAYSIAGEFFRWEFATVIAGKMLEVNPFDEPNVTESKRNTARLLGFYNRDGQLPATDAVMTEGQVQMFADETTLGPLRELCARHGYNSDSLTEVLAAQITGTRAGDYFALLAYFNPTEAVDARLQEVRRRLRHVTKRAVTLGVGPRFLHSTGQFHKGGPNNGVFIQLTSAVAADISIPGDAYSFGTLQAAQAAGDLEALSAHGRRAIRLHTEGDLTQSIAKILLAIDHAEKRRG